jgi:hypothetical protein
VRFQVSKVPKDASISNLSTTTMGLSLFVTTERPFHIMSALQTISNRLRPCVAIWPGERVRGLRFTIP